MVGKTILFGVIQNFNVDKASSLDGYYLAFFQSSWSVIKANMMETFQNFLPTVNLKKKSQCYLYLPYS